MFHCREVGILMEASSLFVVVLSMISIGGSIGPLVRKYDLCQKDTAGASDTEAPRADPSAFMFMLGSRLYSKDGRD